MGTLILFYFFLSSIWILYNVYIYTFMQMYVIDYFVIYF